jgi:hypothetical protein
MTAIPAVHHYCASVRFVGFSVLAVADRQFLNATPQNQIAITLGALWVFTPVSNIVSWHLRSHVITIELT